MKTEKHLQNYLFKQCKAHGIYCRKMRMEGYVGFPDCLLAKDGYCVLVELKNPNGTGKLSKLQALAIKELREHGMEVWIVASKEAVDHVIKTLI